MNEINIEATKVTIPLITDDELNVIDNNLHTITDDFLKHMIRDKDLYLAQYIMKKLEEENQELKKQVDELELIVGIRQKRNLISKFDKEYDEEDKKKNPNRDYACVTPDAEEVYKRYYELKAQQKEFIKYLEDEIKLNTPNARWQHYNEDGVHDYDVENSSCVEAEPVNITLKGVLSAYKKIIEKHD